MRRSLRRGEFNPDGTPATVKIIVDPRYDARSLLRYARRESQQNK